MPGRYFVTITEPYGSYDILRENVLSLEYVDCCVSAGRLLSGEIGSHKRIPAPVKQPRRQAVVLSDCKPLPVVSGSVV